MGSGTVRREGRLSPCLALYHRLRPDDKAGQQFLHERGCFAHGSQRLKKRSEDSVPAPPCDLQALSKETLSNCI